ncbi:ABC transporter permease [Arthrobacter sp. R4]|uniref:ABC transporter permease n=1 Tax=Arthrobacter sp. R4 TaxID=644417 RepID=UPI003EDB5031
MTKFLFTRIFQALLVVAGVLVVTFLITRVLPGDPAVVYAGARATPEQLAAARLQLGLDDPLTTQLANYIGNLFQGDWGTSLRTKRAVLEGLSSVVPQSIQLVTVALIIAIIIGIPLGVIAARFKSQTADRFIQVGSMVFVAFPTFLLGLIAQTVLAGRLGLFPISGSYDSTLDYSYPLTTITGSPMADALITGNWPVFGSSIYHTLLPALVIAVYPVGVITQMTRASLIEEAGLDHARFERALGFSRFQILTRFSLRPALNPVLSLIALVFAFALVNTFLVESIFNWPGLGRYAVAAITALDTPAIAGITIIVAFIYVGLNVLVDLIQGLNDPRVRSR